MANKTTEELQKEIEALKNENAELTQTVAEAAKGPAPMKIPGTATVVMEAPNGDKTKKKVGFRAGRRNVRLPNGAVVPSASFLKVVNGTKLSDDEKANEQLAELTKEAATEHLTYMVSVGSSVVEERK